MFSLFAHCFVCAFFPVIYSSDRLSSQKISAELASGCLTAKHGRLKPSLS